MNSNTNIYTTTWTIIILLVRVSILPKAHKHICRAPSKIWL